MSQTVRCPRCGSPAEPVGGLWWECATCTRPGSAGPLPLPSSAGRMPFVFLIDENGTACDPFTLEPIDPGAN